MRRLYHPRFFLCAFCLKTVENEFRFDILWNRINQSNATFMNRGKVVIIKNVHVFTEEKTFAKGEILIEHGLFQAIKTDGTAFAYADEEVIDGAGAYAIPGLIDLHFHGCKGYDFCDGTKEALTEIAKYEAKIGVTAIAPATMTLPVETLNHILSTAASYKREAAEINPEGADLVGINMEGPFISRVKKGAQDAANIISCNTEICRGFLHASENLVKFVGLAPEENENFETFIQEMKDQVHISLAHTNADYETASRAYRAGADHAIHLFNAMPAFTHREPGVVGAAADYDHVCAEIICDGIHIHPSAVRAAFKMIGEDRMILISDSMRAAGMPDGRYLLGGLEVDVKGKRATLVSDGALAGSVTNLMDCMKNAVTEMGLPLETAVACATMNPAKALGIYDRYGSITAGKNGNMVLLDENFHTKMVIKDGKIL